MSDVLTESELHALREYRLSHDLTYMAMADELGVHYQTLYRVLKGRRTLLERTEYRLRRWLETPRRPRPAPRKERTA